ncbi:hypothetical protein HWV62_3348 [Athelia sp. TMB]|nr:hypothetical protein HWV62_3348 [Athelia sp. TMB]
MSEAHEQINDDAFLEYGLQTGKSNDSLPRTRPSSLSSSKFDLSILEVDHVPVASDIFDPNLDSDEADFEEDSPYPEVRSAVANFDDDTMPASTIRAWVLGIIGAIVLPGVNQFFYFRYPGIVIGSLVAQLAMFPIGRAWARVMPSVKIFGHSLNDGPFTIKEHVLVTIMAGVGATSAYATDIVAVQRVYYGQRYNFSYGWLLVMSTQLIGFSMGGIARRFLVSPPSMSIKLFGYKSGLGFSLLSFDWNQIAFIGSPLATPWWAEANIVVGFIFFFWILTPIFYYTGSWHSQYLPMSSRLPYDNMGKVYNVTAILTEDATIDLEAFRNYSPLYLSITFVMSYALSFMAITSMITHTMLYFWKPIKVQFGRSLREQPDIHARLMSNYRQAMGQAMQFTGDIKLSHYMKIIVATVIAGTVQLGVQSWMFSHIPQPTDDHRITEV